MLTIMHKARGDAAIVLHVQCANGIEFAREFAAL
jgi:hypothetical protein